MDRASSPIFDLPPMRRVKRPLPKRKRISESSIVSQESPAIVSPSPQPPFFRDSSTEDDFVAPTDTLSAQIALQSYYMPTFGGMQDLLKDDRSALQTWASLDFSSSYRASDSHSPGRPDEDAIGDGDYIDHLQQPGNTKKRKVPANMSGSRHGLHDIGLGHSGVSLEDSGGPNNRGVLAPGRPAAVADAEALDIFSSGTGQTTGLGASQRKGKISEATLAGLQHKEMLKSRKRQLAAVLGALSHGDTLALDQALSARYPFGITGDLKSGEPVKIRLSKRKGPRLARAAKTLRSSKKDDKAAKFPSRKFTFSFPSTTSERLVATREEVAMLHSRFEAELARQAAKAEAAKQTISSTVNSNSNLKRSSGAKQALHPSKNVNGHIDPPILDQQALGAKRGNKKKKRSALANASNPHHLRNYVPSRLPSSGHTNLAQNVNSQNYISPPPLRFLSAQIPSRRHKVVEEVPVSNLTNPADEWICPFCEYKLFYGEEFGYNKSVKNRKKILKRRRRAQERAAAAANGKPLNTFPDRGDMLFDDGNREAEFEGPYAKDAVPGAAHKPPRWKTDAVTTSTAIVPTDQYSIPLG